MTGEEDHIFILLYSKRARWECEGYTQKNIKVQKKREVGKE